jgi:hypothetical protein
VSQATEMLTLVEPTPPPLPTMEDVMYHCVRVRPASGACPPHPLGAEGLLGQHGLLLMRCNMGRRTRCTCCV